MQDMQQHAQQLQQHHLDIPNTPLSNTIGIQQLPNQQLQQQQQLQNGMELQQQQPLIQHQNSLPIQVQQRPNVPPSLTVGLQMSHTVPLISTSNL